MHIRRKGFFLLAKCIQELERHGKVPFTAEYVVMNQGTMKSIVIIS